MFDDPTLHGFLPINLYFMRYAKRCEDRGLGYLIVTSTAFFKVPLAWGALVLLSLMGIVLFQVVVIVERVFFPWAVDLDKQTV